MSRVGGGQQRVLVVGAHPLYRLGIRLALADLLEPACILEFDLQHPPTRLGRDDLLILCLQSCPQSRHLINAWLPREAQRDNPVVLISSTVGGQHLQLLRQGVVDRCLPENIGFHEARETLQALLHKARRPAAAVEVERFLPDLEELSRKEQQVLFLLSDGLSNRAIAQQLEICQNTVKVHLARICRKMKVRNRTHAACTANDIRYQQAGCLPAC